MKNLLTTLVIAFLLGTTAGFAQQADDQTTTPQLQKVDVDGKEVAQPAMTPQKAAAKSVKTSETVSPSDDVQTKMVTKTEPVAKTSEGKTHACKPGCTKPCCSAKAKKACSPGCSKACCKGKKGKNAKKCSHSHGHSHKAAAGQPAMTGPKPTETDKK